MAPKTTTKDARAARAGAKSATAGRGRAGSRPGSRPASAKGKGKNAQIADATRPPRGGRNVRQGGMTATTGQPIR